MKDKSGNHAQLPLFLFFILSLTLTYHLSYQSIGAIQLQTYITEYRQKTVCSESVPSETQNHCKRMSTIDRSKKFLEGELSFWVVQFHRRPMKLSSTITTIDYYLKKYNWVLSKLYNHSHLYNTIQVLEGAMKVMLPNKYKQKRVNKYLLKSLNIMKLHPLWDRVWD